MRGLRVLACELDNTLPRAELVDSGRKDQLIFLKPAIIRESCLLSTVGIGCPKRISASFLNMWNMWIILRMGLVRLGLNGPIMRLNILDHKDERIEARRHRVSGISFLQMGC